MMFEPTRAAGLAALADWLPRAGKHYENSRNYDDGMGRENVSQLSPWLHAGLLSEAEVLRAVLAEHGPKAADKFISEVFWRLYFKGYLEQRPTVWSAYCDQRDAALADLDSNSGLSTAYDEATEGRTGIAAFDHWAKELVETGYLHNHARMWFASIWVFTLKLDWTLGADFFLRHLMDGDAASNTLSWRWVAGLHTKGKTYLASAENIARYTANHPHGPLSAEGLKSDASALDEPEEHSRRAFEGPQSLGQSDWPENFALLLHEEAASHVPLNLPQAPAMIIGAETLHQRTPKEVGSRAERFASAAISNGVEAGAEAFNVPTEWWRDEKPLVNLLNGANVGHVVAPYLPVGWTRDASWPHLHELHVAGRLTILLPELQRQTWPHARAGFFKVKKAIPDVLGACGLSGAA